MISRLISFSINNKLIIALLTLGLIAWGLFAMYNIPIDAVPDITNNQVQVVTVTPSLAAQEVEQFITYPIELEMANVQDVDEIRSISRYGLSVVTVVFKEHVPVLDARQLVGQQLQVARQEIPEGYGEPQLMPITTGLGEIYQYTIDVKPGYESEYDASKLRTIHDWIVKRQLNGIPGIVEISSFGGFAREFEVAVNPQLLSSYNLTLLDVNQALKSNNQNAGGSYVQKGPYAYYIRANGLISGLEDIENIVITTVNDVPILVKHIADVGFGHAARFGAMTKDGKGEAVGGITLMLKGGNASKVIKEVKTRIEQIQKSMPEGLEIVPYLDRAELVGKVIRTVSKNLIEGGLIVIFILVLLLGNLRAGFIVASIIPLSMLFAFAMMRMFGVTATVMSLGAIDFGLIVDASVIIVESILFHIHRNHSRLKSGETSINTIVHDTTQKIKTSAAFGAIIILIVYFPILSLTGIEGKMFKPMAMTVSFAIAGALILSFTYVPMVASLLLKPVTKEKVTIADKLMRLFYRSYRPVFAFALRNKVAVLIAAGVLLLTSGAVFTRLGAEFLPDLDEGDLAMQMTISQGGALSESVRTSTVAEQVLLDNFEEVKTVVSKIGTAEVPTDPMAIQDADIMIILKPRDEWVNASTRSELVDKMKEKLEVVSGATFEFTQPIQLRFNELLTGAKADVVVKIYGDDLDILYKKANEMASIINEVPGAADVKVEQIEGWPQLVIDYDRERIARYGLNIEEINTMIRTALAGEKAGVVFEGERKFDLVVRLQKEYRNEFSQFSRLFVKTPDGTQIPLDAVADISFVNSPAQISRDNTQRRISIGINVRNRDVQSLVEEVEAKVKQVKLPSGYYTSYGGKFENLQSAMARLKLVVPIAVLLIFVILYFAFGTLKQAGIILTTIPLSIIGGIFALWMRDLPFSISAGIGFIALFGVAVLDGIVLINHLNELKVAGINNIHRRLIMATKNRLRPVIVTSAVASLGFLPMAISTTAGAEVQRPLATVVIGGIITSTFLTMVVLPLVYYYFERGIRIAGKKSLLTVFVLLGFSSFSFGQVPEEYRTISLDRAIEKAMANHPNIMNYGLSVEQLKLRKQSTFDFGTTEFVYQKGQLNSAISDHYLSIRQNLGNIMQQRFMANYFASKSELAKAELAVQKGLLKHDVVKLYNEWNHYQQKKELLLSTLKLFSRIDTIMEIQYQTGAVNKIAKFRIDTKIRQLELEQLRLMSVLEMTIEDFNFLLFSDTVFTPDRELLGTGFGALTKDASIGNSAYVAKEQELLKMQGEQHSLTKSAYFPELSIGYFNQQIESVKGFEGIEIGATMPLIFYSQHKKVAASKIDLEKAQHNYEFQLASLENELKQLQLRKSQLAEELSFYEESALKYADKILEDAIKKLRLGEIDYIEFMPAIQEAIDIKDSHLDCAKEYKEIENLIGLLCGA